MNTIFKNKIIISIVLAIFFGLFGGFVGELITRVYILQNAFNIPLFGDLNLQSNKYGNSNLIIRNPNNVIVQQNTKIQETLNSAKKNIVGIFLRKEPGVGSTTVVAFDNYYIPSQRLGQGFIFSADGWIFSYFAPTDLKSFKSSSTKTLALKKYVAISSDKKIFDIDDYAFNSSGSYAFWHIKADDLPVKKIAQKSDLKNGELLLITNWDLWAQVNYILSSSAHNSDKINILLNTDVNKALYNSFVFDLNDKFVGVTDARGYVLSAKNIENSFFSLTKKQKKKLVLGANYLNLANLIKAKKDDLPKFGLLLYNDKNKGVIEKGSLAESLGLKEGDCIIAINDVYLDEKSDVDELLNLNNDKLKIIFIRNNKEISKSIKI